MVGIAKKILKKAKEQDPYLLILEYRNSPLPDCNISPAQLLLSRRTRSIVPITNKLLKPQGIDPKNVQKSIFRSKSLHDRTAKALSPLHVIDQLCIQFDKIWKQPPRVIQQHDARSFSVLTRGGVIYRRNRRHLIKTQMNTPRVEPFNPSVLAQPAQPETATSLSPDTPVTTLPQSNHSNTKSQQRPPNMPYITRPGREVEINSRYNNDNWITN